MVYFIKDVYRPNEYIVINTKACSERYTNVWQQEKYNWKKHVMYDVILNELVSILHKHPLLMKQKLHKYIRRSL